MRSGEKNESRLFRFFYLFFLAFFFLLLISLAACGRRGDPVAILPPEKKAAAADQLQSIEDKGAETAADQHEAEEMEAAVPDPPAGLDALFTQRSIILTWDEVTGQGVVYYRIYRSEGEGFALVGDSMTPAFTDRNIEKNTRYLYRVTAFGQGESPPSDEIEIFTGVDKL